MKILVQSGFSNRMMTYVRKLLVLPVPEKHRSEFNRSLRIANHRYLTVMSIFGLILGFVFLATDIFPYLQPHPNPVFFYFICLDILLIVFLSITLLLVKRNWVLQLVEGNRRGIDIGHFYYFVILIWTAVVTGLAGIDHYHYLYLIIACVMGVILFYFKNYKIVFYYLSALAVFFILSWWKAGEFRFFDENQTPVYFAILCILIARVRIFDKLSNYLEEQKVREYINELNKIKRQLQDRVIDRTYDLAKMNEELKKEIKQRASLEEQLIHSQKMEAMGDLAGGIAHDFNNILAIIQGFSELLITYENLDLETKKTVEKINTAAERGYQLVKQILMFSRKETEANKMIDLCDVVKEAISMIEVAAPKTITIKYENLFPDARIIGNSNNLHQLVLNMGINAIHAMQGNKKGELIIRVSAFHKGTDYVPQGLILAEYDYVLLQIIDNGHGIKKELAHRIFEPYFTTKKKGEGTGMGLSIVHSIVKNHGGEIYIETGRECGACFHILLPLAESE